MKPAVKSSGSGNSAVGIGEINFDVSKSLNGGSKIL